MDQIVEERNRVLLAKPLRHSVESSDKNIFASLQKTEPLPTLHKIRGKSYDVVGSKEFREKILESEHQNQPTDNNATMNMTVNQTNLNTTINRQTIMSKITQDQKNSLVK